MQGCLLESKEPPPHDLEQSDGSLKGNRATCLSSLPPTKYPDVEEYPSDLPWKVKAAGSASRCQSVRVLWDLEFRCRFRVWAF